MTAIPKTTEPKTKRGLSPASRANLAKSRGRPKGVPNKVTTAIKDMIIGALNDAGGREYLRKLAETNPTAFVTLVGKVIPLDVNANMTTRTFEPKSLDDFL